MAALRGGHPALTDQAAWSGRGRRTSPHFGRAHTAPRISGPARSPPRRMSITPAVRCPQSRTSPEFRVSSTSLQTICRSYQHSATGRAARGHRRRLLPVFLRRPLAPWERRVDRHPRDSSCDGQMRGSSQLEFRHCFRTSNSPGEATTRSSADSGAARSHRSDEATAGHEPATPATGLLPLDGSGRLRRDIQHDAVHAGYLVRDAVRDAGEYVVGHARPVGGHRVF